MHQYTGTLTMHVGPMFGGKTTALREAVKKFQLAGYSVKSFKPMIDNRYSNEDYIVTHDGRNLPCHRIRDVEDIIRIVNESNPDVIAIDELQFIKDPKIVQVILNFIKQRKTVIAAGLDLTFDLKPFDTVKELMPYATYLHKHQAVCTKCGKDASTSFRKTDSKDEVQTGGKESYEPLCLECYFESRQRD